MKNRILDSIIDKISKKEKDAVLKSFSTLIDQELIRILFI